MCESVCVCVCVCVHLCVGGIHTLASHTYMYMNQFSVCDREGGGGGCVCT